MQDTLYGNENKPGARRQKE